MILCAIFFRQAPSYTSATTAYGWTLLTCSTACFSLFFFFEREDGLSKHVVLFKNSEEKVVTIGFVWRRLLHTPRACSLDTSDLSKTLFHLLESNQGVSPIKATIWKKKHRRYHGKSLFSPFVRINVFLFSWPYRFSLSFRYGDVLALILFPDKAKLLNHGAQTVSGGLANRAIMRHVKNSAAVCLMVFLHTTSMPAAPVAWNVKQSVTKH